MGSQGFLEYCQIQGERFEDAVLLALKMMEEAVRQECRQPLEAGKWKEMYSLLVLVCSGCHNNTTGRRLKQKNISHCSGAYTSKIKAMAGVVSDEVSLHGWWVAAFSLCPRMAFPLHVCGGKALWCPTLVTHLTLVTSLEAVSPNTGTWGWGCWDFNIIFRGTGFSQ